MNKEQEKELGLMYIADLMSCFFGDDTPNLRCYLEQRTMDFNGEGINELD